MQSALTSQISFSFIRNALRLHLAYTLPLHFLSWKLHGQKLHLCFGTQLSRGGGGRVERREGVDTEESTDAFCFVINHSSPPSHFRNTFEIRIVLLGLTLRDP